MKRHTLTGILMLFSELLLCAFLVTWLCAQWNAEEENLRKGLKFSFATVAREVTDSAMGARVMGPLSQRGVLPPKNGPQDVQIMIRKDDEQSAHLPKPPRTSVMVHRSTWSNGRDSFSMEERDTTVVRFLAGVQELLASAMPDSLQKALATKDTGRISTLFRKALADEGQHFPFKWANRKAIEKPGAFLIKGDGVNALYVVSVTGYQAHLIQKILPQILFALGLVLITSFAFSLAWRSLQRERKLSLMKNNLVSNMSHELKTPVSTVKVALEALGEEEVLNDRQTVREYVGMANSELQRLELLINSSLHTSLLESGKLPMQFESLDLLVVTRDISDSMQLRSQKTQAQISLSFTPGDYTIKGDRLHIQGVLINILDNALKYGGEGVAVQIQGSADTSGVSIAIADNGPGIPKAYHRRVFERFFRVPTGNLHEVKGYGLGLNYAAEVMRRHKGSIIVSSPQSGGAMFTLFFPKSLS